MSTSQNGWPVIASGSSPLLTSTPWIIGKIRAGDAAVVLDYLAARFNAEVEPIRKAESWGYANREIRGSTAISNHASATAEDYNAPSHPLGRSGTFTPAQVAAIRRILASLDGVVRWGGDYTGRKDEMHFELVKGPAAVAAVADRIRSGQLVSNPIGGGGVVPEAPTVAAPTKVKPTNPLKGKRMLIYAGGGIWLLDGGRMLPIGDPKSADALAASGVPSVTISRADADRWIATGGPGLLLVRGPGTRGVALLGGKDGWSSMTSEADVTKFQGKGVPLVDVSDGQFVALMN